MSVRSVLSILALVSVICCTPCGSELIRNGDFSAGFADWTVTELAGSAGDWFISKVGAITPRSFLTTTSEHGAAEGDYALTDQTAPGTHALTQGFTIPSSTTSAILSFDMFVNDADSGPVIDPVGLDHSGPDNQHARVDILSAGAPTFDTGLGVVSNLYLGVDVPQASNPQPFNHYEFDITSLAGGDYSLRFAETDNLATLNMGVDNVSISVMPAVPEPEGQSFWALIMFGVVVLRRRRMTRLS